MIGISPLTTSERRHWVSAWPLSGSSTSSLDLAFLVQSYPPGRCRACEIVPSTLLETFRSFSEHPHFPSHHRSEIDGNVEIHHEASSEGATSFLHLVLEYKYLRIILYKLTIRTTESQAFHAITTTNRPTNSIQIKSHPKAKSLIHFTKNVSLPTLHAGVRSALPSYGRLRSARLPSRIRKASPVHQGLHSQIRRQGNR